MRRPSLKEGLLGVAATLTACVGAPQALPSPVESDDDGEASGGETSSGGIAETSETTGGITVCGNGVVEGDEECDGTDWQGHDCKSLGLSGGSLSCTDECVFERAGCVPPMRFIPSGVFQMGESVAFAYVPSFWIDETEVTVANYEQCVNAQQCTVPETGARCNWDVDGREDHPINCLTWAQASGYCGWVDHGTRRLSTRMEWEKAARGTDGRTYPWGNEPAPNCDVVVKENDAGSGCGGGTTMPAGSKLNGASPYGLLNMAGNVSEWVHNSGEIPEDHVICGGNFEVSDEIWFRVYACSSFRDQSHQVGFRCAKDFEPDSGSSERPPAGGHLWDPSHAKVPFADDLQ